MLHQALPRPAHCSIEAQRNSTMCSTCDKAGLPCSAVPSEDLFKKAHVAVKSASSCVSLRCTGRYHVKLQC